MNKLTNIITYTTATIGFAVLTLVIPDKAFMIIGLLTTALTFVLAIEHTIHGGQK